MNLSNLIFVGIGGRVTALDRTTGKIVWTTLLKGGDFVNVALQKDLLLATCHGEVFCLDPATGAKRWHNPLKGFGTGLATLAAEGIGAGDNLPLMAEKRRRDEQAAAAGTTAVVAAG